MITVLEYAYLSSDVYNEPSKFKLIHVTTKRDSNLNGWRRVTDVDPFVISEHPFFAALYIKFEEGQAMDAVIAIRGTMKNELANLKEDVESFYSDVLGDGSHTELPSYLINAKNFAFECRTYLIHHFPEFMLGNLRHTGHSLGGALAQLMSLTGTPYPAVVFNSPGCAEMPEIDREDAEVVYNINSRYDIFNKMGHTLGHVSVIEVPQDEAVAKNIFHAFNRKDFSNSLQEEARSKQLSGVKKTTTQLKGMSSRIDAYLSTLSAVKQSALYRQKELLCDNESMLKDWQSLTNLFQHKSCTTMSLLETYGEVIEAQHSIDHLIEALQEPRYKEIS